MALKLSPGCRCCGCQRDVIVAVHNCTYPGPTATNIPTGAEATLTSDECQTIAIGGTPVGGYFTLSFGGATTGPLYWNASSATITVALAALPTIGAGNVVDISASFPGTAGTVVAFVGALAAASQAIITATVTDSDGNPTLKTTGWGLGFSAKATGGDFTLAVNGRPTGRIPFDADAAAVQTILEGMVGAGNVAVSEGPLPAVPVHIEFADTSVVLAVGANALQGNPVPSLQVVQGGGGTASVAVAELLEGGQVLGPQAVDATTGQTTSTSVPNGEWEWIVTADHYKDLAGRFTLTCPPQAPLVAGGLMDPEDGYLIFPNTGTPYRAPATLTLTDPLGSTTLNLIGFADGTPPYSRGTAFYQGSNTFNPIQRTCTFDPTFCPDTPPVTINTFEHAITYWASIGCATSLFAHWAYDVAGTFEQVSCGACAGPISPPVILTKSDQDCGFPFDNGITCSCTVSTGTALQPPLATLGLCYGARESEIAGAPVDVVFDTQWGDGSNCDGLAGLLHYLYGVPFLHGGQTLNCVSVSISE